MVLEFQFLVGGSGIELQNRKPAAKPNWFDFNSTSGLVKPHMVARFALPVKSILPDAEYNRQKKLSEMKLESLVIPQVNAAQEAGKLIYNLPNLWEQADTLQRRKIVQSMLDAVYIETMQYKTIVAITPKPPFRPILQMAVSRKGSDIRILNEPLKIYSKVPSISLKFIC
ncbi:MAG: hypothetical protein PHU23_14980 [Dehalococcoidales bacterium]|nr:hypothetical protein [Dehalococcoidales bacterium]